MFIFADRIQIFSIIFSLVVFGFIFWLVKHRKVKEEYSILWFATSLFFLYLSLDRYAVDRLASLFGIAYKPTFILLVLIGFITLVLIHVTVVITRQADQNRKLVQELGLANFRREIFIVTGAQPRRTANLLAIVPAYNEEGNIAEVIRELKNQDIPLDILVVNDGSLDRTGPMAKTTGEAMVVDLPANLGIGGAVQTGFKYASRYGYTSAIQFDADGQHLAAEIPKLLGPLEKTNMVIGSRFLEKNGGFRSTFARRIGIKLFQAVNSLLIGQKITDNTSGFRAYDKEAIDFLARHYPIDYPEPEAVILLGKNGFRMREEATRMRERRAGGSSIAGLKSGYYMIKVLLAVFMTALRRPIRTSV